MKHSATSSDLARASWPLPEPTLTYFPNARFANSDRDLGACAPSDLPGGSVVVDTADHGHIPVLLDRCVELLAPALTRTAADGSGALLIDATLGAGGHAERFLTDFPGLRLIGLDRDPTALAKTEQRLAPFADRITLVRTRYDGIVDALAEADCATTESVDGVLFDLGVSSMQLDQPERGFSYAKDAPLDMRMDPEAPLTAAGILNTYERAELTDILRRFGEEKFAHRIAGLIVERRKRAPLTTTSELVEIIYQGIPAPARRTGGHPAKRTFQALRIAVNAELDSLTAALPAALAALRPGGRVVVMAYQSLEDRIVKTTFAEATASRSPQGLPVELPGYEPEFMALTRGAERADADEIERNPRSAPVRLRAVERVTTGNPGRGGK
ncbi:16S rRNA (cytosine(1402)-N(4))-methyltransferase RsmH [Mycobacterium sp. NBC_00419]|uniref:16S rRNA (cytosine(1402)-N(4))-methyltransferase RsmH n=1 Tax=Mycobacterium sp. NBC_00419 TaxID=2975989 RepID=UPI002E23B8D0